MRWESCIGTWLPSIFLLVMSRAVFGPNLLTLLAPAILRMAHQFKSQILLLLFSWHLSSCWLAQIVVLMTQKWISGLLEFAFSCFSQELILSTIGLNRKFLLTSKALNRTSIYILLLWATLSLTSVRCPMMWLIWQLVLSRDALQLILSSDLQQASSLKIFGAKSILLLHQSISTKLSKS